MTAIVDSPGREEQIVEEGGLPTEAMFLWMSLLNDLLGSGFTGTITTAALTGGGAQGTMVFVNGVLISQIAAT